MSLWRYSVVSAFGAIANKKTSSVALEALVKHFNYILKGRGIIGVCGSRSVSVGCMRVACVFWPSLVVSVCLLWNFLWYTVGITEFMHTLLHTVLGIACMALKLRSQGILMQRVVFICSRCKQRLLDISSAWTQRGKRWTS
jgi:hypothetical protein